MTDFVLGLESVGLASFHIIFLRQYCLMSFIARQYSLMSFIIRQHSLILFDVSQHLSVSSSCQTFMASSAAHQLLSYFRLVFTCVIPIPRSLRVPLQHKSTWIINMCFIISNTFLFKKNKIGYCWIKDILDVNNERERWKRASKMIFTPYWKAKCVWKYIHYIHRPHIFLINIRFSYTRRILYRE